MCVCVVCVYSDEHRWNVYVYRRRGMAIKVKKKQEGRRRRRMMHTHTRMNSPGGERDSYNATMIDVVAGSVKGLHIKSISLSDGVRTD